MLEFVETAVVVGRKSIVNSPMPVVACPSGFVIVTLRGPPAAHTVDMLKVRDVVLLKVVLPTTAPLTFAEM
jgi:hypothetical protein